MGVGSSSGERKQLQERRKQLSSLFPQDSERKLINEWLNACRQQEEIPIIIAGSSLGDLLLQELGMKSTFQQRLKQVVSINEGTEDSADNDEELKLFTLIAALTGRLTVAQQGHSLAVFLKDIGDGNKIILTMACKELEAYSAVSSASAVSESFIKFLKSDNGVSPSAANTETAQEPIEKVVERSAPLQRLISNLFTRILLTTHDTNSHAIAPAEQLRLQRQIMVAPAGQPLRRSHLLNGELLWFLHQHLPVDCRSEWSLRFSTALAGHSWNAFNERVVDAECSLLLVRDSKGNIFGGFAGQQWRISTKFYGPASCFLFTLIPHLQAYPSTNYNQNFMYFQQGKQQLLNGIAMGGQMDYFALFIDQTLQRGHSKADPISTTFGNPPLIAANGVTDNGEGQFEVDFIEVWAVKPLEKDDRLLTDKERRANALSRADLLDFLEDSGVKVFSRDLGPDKPEEAKHK